MGSKRAFDSKEFEEIPYKHPRQHESIDKPASFSELAPLYLFPQKLEFSGQNEGGFHELQWHDALEKDTFTEISDFDDKDLESSNPFSWVTSISSEEDTGSGGTTLTPLSPEHGEYNFPRRTFSPSEDAYSSLLYCSPRKQVPIGPNHQASLPIWRGFIEGTKLDINDNLKEEKLMGTCVIPMPYLNLLEQEDVKSGESQMDCDCTEEGSVRCIRQHITESREKLRRTLGDEKFVNLGFLDMGEEVNCKWSEEEEQMFHDTVYSNPKLSGRNFWTHLSVPLPARNKKELVSYYFNVFILRRRATQNRSQFLDVDSDDDEWQGRRNIGSYRFQVQVEHEDSAIESLVVQVGRGGHEVDSSEEEESGNIDDESEEEGGVEEDTVDPIVHNLDKNAEKDLHGGQDDSCMSLESQFKMSDLCRPDDDTVSEQQITGGKTGIGRSLHSKSNVSGYNLSEPSAIKAWDVRLLTRPREDAELLPTWKMIEEIFGQDVEFNKMDHGKGSS